MKKGGAAKGELVLAMYELANSFRHGWGVDKDPVAARSYYETAANLGDTDAMNEVARCYEEGFGGKKDRVCPVQLQSLGTCRIKRNSARSCSVLGLNRFVHADNESLWPNSTPSMYKHSAS